MPNAALHLEVSARIYLSLKRLSPFLFPLNTRYKMYEFCWQRRRPHHMQFCAIVCHSSCRPPNRNAYVDCNIDHSICALVWCGCGDAVDGDMACICDLRAIPNILTDHFTHHSSAHRFRTSSSVPLNFSLHFLPAQPLLLLLWRTKQIFSSLRSLSFSLESTEFISFAHRPFLRSTHTSTGELMRKDRSYSFVFDVQNEIAVEKMIT